MSQKASMQMPTVNWKPPRYVVVKQRPNGAIDFFYSIPAKLRPEGWAPTVRLPRDARFRTRDASAKELSAVEQDAAIENAKLDMERAGVISGDKAGTIPWAIERWQNDDRYAFASLKPRSQSLYDNATSKIMLWHQMQPFASMGHIKWPDIVAYLDAFNDRPGTMKIVRVVLRQLFDVAKDYGHVEVNPFTGEEKRKSRRTKKEDRKAFKRWTDERVELAAKICDDAGFKSIGTAIIVGFDMMQYPDQLLGMRRGDHYNDGFFDYTRGKTGERGLVRASKRAQERLKDAGLYLFTSETTGLPWTREAFGARFRLLMDTNPQTKGLLFKHLRHCGAMEARRAGVSWEDIATIGAWKSVKGAQDAISPVIDMFYRIPDFEKASAAMEKREALRAGADTQSVVAFPGTSQQRKLDTD